MSIIRSGKPEIEVEEDRSINTVSEVENDIREFVRNDVAYLRRPGGQAASGGRSRRECNRRVRKQAVANVNSLIQRVAGASLAEIGKLIDELENTSRSSTIPEGSACSGNIRLLQLSQRRHEVDAHDRRQCRSVENVGREA